MALNKRLLKQQAYKRIARPAASASNIKSLGHNKNIDTKQLNPFGTNVIHLVLGNTPVGCGVWKYGKYLQPAKKTTQYIKQASLMVGVMPKASPLDKHDDSQPNNQPHTIEFTGAMEPSWPWCDIDLNGWFNPGTSARLSMSAISPADRVYNTGKSNIAGYMVQELKKRHPDEVIIYRSVSDHEMVVEPMKLRGVELRRNPGEFDMTRMQEALGSETIQAPSGMSREEIREFILNAGKDDTAKASD